MAVLLATLCSLASTTALAQDDSELSGTLSTTSTTTTSTAVVLGGIMLTLVLITPSKRRRAQLEHYLRTNGTALQRDIALGGGRVSADLATYFHVAPARRRAFARLLRPRYRQLLPLADPQRVDAARAARFYAIVCAAMLAEPQLEADALECLRADAS